MPQFGEVRVDFITFTTGVSPDEANVTVPVSGLLRNPTFSGNVIISGDLDVYGDITNSGNYNTVTGNITTTGGTISGAAGQFTTLTGSTAGFTTVTGTTVTGTTANFVTVSGTTVTGDTGNFTTVTITSGVFASGTAAAPSVSIGTTDNGLYSPGTDEVALATAGTGRLFISDDGKVGIGVSDPSSYNVSADDLVIADPNGFNSGISINITDNTGSSNIWFGDSDGEGRGTITYGHGTSDSLVFNVGGSAALRIEDTGTVNFVGAGSVGSTQAVSFNGSAPINSLVIDSTGNVGVGTSSPQALGHFSNTAGSAEVRITCGGSAVSGESILRFGNVNDQTMASIRFDSTNDNLSFYSTNDTRAMTIDSSQRVGIGTTSPDVKLETTIDSAVQWTSGANLSNSANLPFVGLSVSNEDTSITGTECSLLIKAGGSSAAMHSLTVKRTGNNIGDLIFRRRVSTASSESMRIDNSGRLLVGTTSASVVSTTLLLQGSPSSSVGPSFLRLATGTATPGATSTIGQISFTDSGHSTAASIVAFRDGGTWTSGSSQPTRLTFSTCASGASSPTERMRIDSSGRVGIGTTSPGGTLEVSDSSQANVSVGDLLVDTTGLSAAVTVGRRSSRSNDNTTFRVRDREDNDILYASAAGDPFRVGRNGSEFARIDTSGRLLVGTSSSSTASRLVIAGTSSGDAYGIARICSTSSTPGNGDLLGLLSFGDSSHTNAAWVKAERDGGTWTSGSSQPGRLVFSTTADGASSPTERMRITSAGNIEFNTTYTDPQGATLSLRPGFLASATGGVGLGCKNHSGSANDGLGIYGHDGVSIQTAGNNERMRIDSSGNVLIGGTTQATADIALNADGNATFAGYVNVADYLTGTGIRLNDWGEVISRVDGAKAAAFSAYQNGLAAGDVKARIYNDGSAFFKAPSGSGVEVQNVGGNDGSKYPFVGKNSSGTTTFSVNGDGSAYFASNVGIGTTAPGELLTVNGTNQSVLVRTTDLNGSARIKFNADDGNYAGIGLENSALVMRCSNSSTPTERARIDSSGRLLVGTSSTTQTNTRAIFQGTTASATGTGYLYLSMGRNNPTSGQELGTLAFSDNGHVDAARIAGVRDAGTWTSGSSQPTRLVFATTADGASSTTERMRIDSSGNVGIGTTGPSTPLHVASSSGTQLTLVRTGTTSDYSLKFLRGGRSDQGIFTDGTGISLRAIDATNGVTSISLLGDNVNSNDIDRIQFNVYGSERMRIDSSGRLLVGRTSGPEMLCVAGNIQLDNSSKVLSSSSAGTLQIQGGATYSGGNILLGGGTGTNDIRFRTTGQSATQTERMRIDSSGKVGLGATDPSSYNILADNLVIKGTGHEGITIQSGNSNSGNIWFTDSDAEGRGQITYHHLSDALYFSTAESEAMRIDSSGRLLVGTSTARSNFYNSTESAALQVEGSGSAGRISVLRSDSAGTVILGYTPTALNGNALGSLSFQGNDGSEFVEAVQILAQVDGTPGANDMPGRLVFSTTADGASSPTERMRITNGGLTRLVTTNHSLEITSAASAGTTFYLIDGRSGGTIGSVGSGSTTFRVYTNGNAVNTNNSYGAISDIKLKENIVDARSQWDDIKDIRVRNYNFIEGQTHTQIGVVAQEAELVSPGLISESPDLDEEGNDLGTVTKSVNYSVLYMKAVKALQEAMERIETLEQRLSDAGIA